MAKSMFREIKDKKDVMDIVAEYFAFLAIPAVVFVIVVALWTILVLPVDACSPGICKTPSITKYQ